MRSRLLLTTLLVLLLASACGQKGPLYLPEEEPGDRGESNSATDSATGASNGS